MNVMNRKAKLKNVIDDSLMKITDWLKFVIVNTTHSTNSFDIKI